MKTFVWWVMLTISSVTMISLLLSSLPIGDEERQLAGFLLGLVSGPFTVFGALFLGDDL